MNAIATSGIALPSIALTMTLTVLAVMAGCSDAPVARGPDSPGRGATPASIATSQLLRQPGGFYTDDGPDGAVPVNIATLPDAQPKAEPLHASANEPYTVFGHDYTPLRTAAGYKRQGTASWYGRKFHGQKTAGGEVYDMYAMTAAHPTLPIPSYARITSLENNRSVVVRINDRGPFGSGRIMDVSYAVASKLGFAESALAPVTVEGLATGSVVTTVAAEPYQPTVIATASDRRGIFLQLGAFSSRGNADNFRERLRRQLDWAGNDLDIEFRDRLYRVQLGPYRDRATANSAADKVRAAVEIKPIVVVR